MDYEILAQARAAVLRVESTAEVILYGSRARGDAQEDSDWDLLILVDGEVDGQRTWAIRETLLDVELETGAVLSSIIRSRVDWDSPRLRATPFHANVEREGVRL
jgi:predicted nucleotidyltransferase